MKKCGKCGKTWPDEAEFCGDCGARLDSMEMKPVTTVNRQTEDKKRKPHKRPLIIGIAAVCIVAGVGAYLYQSGGLDSLFSDDKNSCVYVSNGKYILLKNIGDDTAIELGECNADIYLNDFVKYSPGGKYVYYIENYDRDTNTGSLWRCRYKQLSKNSGKNDKLCEKIAENIQLVSVKSSRGIYASLNGNNYYLLDDERLVYVNGSDELCYYDGSQMTIVAESVNAVLYADQNGHVAYENGSADDGFSLEYVELSKPDSQKELAAGYSYLKEITDLHNIVYMKETEEGDYDVYLTDIDQETEKLGKSPYEDSAAFMEYQENSDLIYYLVEDGTTCAIWDFVKDDYADTDADLQVPDLNNYVVEDRATGNIGYDFDSYNADCEEYEKAQTRIAVRQELEDSNEEVKLQGLYCYHDGEKEVLGEDIVEAGSLGDNLLLVKLNKNNTLDIDEITSAEDLDEELTKKLWKDSFYTVSGENMSLVQLPSDIFLDDTFQDNIQDIFVTDSHIYLNIAEDSTCKVMGADISRKAGDFETVIDNSKIVIADGDRLYIAKSDDKDTLVDYDNSGVSASNPEYVDIYSYQNGESSLLVQGVLLLETLSDGEQAAVTGYDFDNGDWNIVLLDADGSKTEINKYRSIYRLDDSNLLYVSDDSLWIGKGENKEMVAPQAEYVWCQNAIGW